MPHYSEENDFVFQSGESRSYAHRESGETELETADALAGVELRRFFFFSLSLSSLSPSWLVCCNDAG